ncbi:MAG: hypothetical protein ACD_60C00162G0006 [uncultured bacterium]|nr:MAG: hypothetical protein ACD_60C00162G0006 [uncultured bacterium]
MLRNENEEKQEALEDILIRLVQEDKQQQAKKIVEKIAWHTSLIAQKEYLCEMLALILKYLPLEKENEEAKINDLLNNIRNYQKMEEGYSFIEAQIIKFDEDVWRIIEKLCRQKINDTSTMSDIYHQPVQRLPRVPKNQSELSDRLGAQGAQHYRFTRAKKDGYNKDALSGEYIFCYQTENDLDGMHVQRILIKRDARQAHNIAEIVASKIMQLLIEDKAANVSPIKMKDDVYVASYFCDPSYSAIELFKDLYKSAGEEPPLQRPKLLYTPCVQNGFTAVFEENIANKNDPSQCAYEGYESTTAASLFVKDFDTHTANYMVLKIKKDGLDKKGLMRIDFGEALKNLTDDDNDVHMHSHWRHKPFVGPTNHLREFPRHFRISFPFAKELERISNFNQADLKLTISKAVDEAANHYDKKSLTEFAQYIGMKVPKEIGKQTLVDKIKVFLTEKMYARQTSMLNLALEIRISLLVKREGSLIQKNEELDKLIKENPSYFQKGDFHLRGKNHAWQLFRGLRVHQSFYQNALKAYANNILNEQNSIHEVFKEDFQITDISLRAEALIDKLMKVNPGSESKVCSSLEEQGNRLLGAKEKYEKSKNKKIALKHLICECDRSYREIISADDQLRGGQKNSPSFEKKQEIGDDLEINAWTTHEHPQSPCSQLRVIRNLYNQLNLDNLNSETSISSVASTTPINVSPPTPSYSISSKFGRTN